MDDEWDLDDLDTLEFDDLLTSNELRFKFRRELEIVDDETELFGDVN